jgi:hypothetical protein
MGAQYTSAAGGVVKRVRQDLQDNSPMTMQRVVQKITLHSAPDRVSGDLQYWLSQPVAARLAAVELLRQQMGGQDAERRLQRVCRITQLKPG